ncbi:DNA-binding CsgD family transcriptional regulator [Bradyrhizobium huanghuaihaiense]|jgi:DNA-binding CsgD family transcriptional regulator|uniref:Transcriptional regulatory protein n=10 Tax=Bradyrhizobium TaxID=374 RepID=Q89B94_BRADU|nr:transcriptional regulator [Bradyrhizobium japonicum]AWL93363.1 helix-turn-helix transcriptional regulator [Bradyrhizobium ottawaense]MDH6686543.1 DNA-binding CsgD family transcriptional regulator [Bradyrhizobium elkanii]NLS74704.1 helix-turn-helix transcriptional regulator [Bradyrhizobium brasilense]QOZ14413.1 helix-turn-helix transcriptional regulator [Bradyrhizobium sp. CCBAU 21365]TWH94990.1 DNA-binding CsgD family transcriptional regulator [Bradyrhizobium daqingense]TWI59426.1 DNA-bind
MLEGDERTGAGPKGALFCPSELRIARGERPSMIGTLDLLGRPAILIDQNGFVAAVNDNASKLFDDDLSVKGRRLFAADAQSRLRLDRLITQVRFLSGKPGRSTLQTVVTRSQRRPIVIDAIVQDWESAGDPLLPDMGALLILTDLNEIPRVSQSSVMEIFGLTPAQARLASLLVEGKSLEEIAFYMNISSGTARNHLKAVFLRTGTRRQAELVSLLSRLL